MKYYLYFLCICFTIAGIYGCLNSTCKTTAIKRAINPARTVQAVRVRIECDATTTPSSTIRIIENANEKSNGKPENTLIGAYAKTDFYWKGNDTLVIRNADASGYLVKDTYPLTKTKGQLVILYTK